jgi:hypothetical protein
MLQQQPSVPVAAGGVRGKREGDHDGGGKDRMGLNVQSIARQREVNRAKGRGVSCCQIGFDPRAKRDGLLDYSPQTSSATSESEQRFIKFKFVKRRNVAGSIALAYRTSLKESPQ